MIVPSMNSEELSKEILQDFIIVKRKAEHLVEKTRREAIKSKGKYCHKEFPYLSTQKNQWVIFVDYYKKDPVYTAVVTYQNGFGFNAIMVESNLSTLVHYTSHFLERFNERFLKIQNTTKLEILKNFAKKNPCSTNHFFPQSIDSQYNMFGVFNQGIGLGYTEMLRNNALYHYKTFITTDMIRNGQKPIFEYLRKDYERFLIEPYKIRRLGLSA